MQTSDKGRQHGPRARADALVEYKRGRMHIPFVAPLSYSPGTLRSEDGGCCDR